MASKAVARAIDIVATTTATQIHIRTLAERMVIPELRRDRTCDREGEVQAIRNQIWHGVPYYMDRDVMPQVIEAARAVPDVAKFTPDMFPSAIGFVVLARPWPVASDSGVMDVTAISWEFIKPFDASEDDPFCAVAITSWADDGEYLEYTVGIEDASKTLSEYKHGMDCTKALYALFAFLKKKILVAERSESRPRAQRRAAEWTDPPDVFVIIYRKAASRPRETGESSPVDWSCRWLSREHWGIRYHGGGDQRVPVVTLISASIKGPEGKPMRVSPQTMGAIIR